MGGAIAPGIGISAEMLSNRAAQLPEVAIKKPQHIIGKNQLLNKHNGDYSRHQEHQQYDHFQKI